MSLIEKRGHKQSIITKLKSKLARLVALDNLEEAKSHVIKLNSAFDQSLGDDVAKCDIENNKFIEIEMMH